MAGIFINYRRSDTPGYAGRIYDHLSGGFGKSQVFRDIDRIKPGRDFVKEIDNTISACDALLVLIGGSWLTVSDENGRRLHDDGDFVRMEISKALKRGVPVIPVLLPGSDKMPEASDLPEDLAPLSRFQAIKISDETWDHDMERLSNALLEEGIKPILSDNENQSDRGRNPSKMPMAVAIFAFVALVAVVLGVMLFDQSDNNSVVDVNNFDRRDEPRQFVNDNNVGQIGKMDASVASAKPPPFDPTLADPGVIAEAQRLLASLGYSPGPADGIPGTKTKTAIRSFQRSKGMASTGTITPELVDELYAAVEDQRDAATVAAAVTRIPRDDLSGVWYDDLGIRYDLVHSRNSLGGKAYSPLTGEEVATVSGTYVNGVWTYTFNNVAGVGGSGTATMEPDNRHMATMSTDTLTNMTVPGRMHRGHMAQW